jgi:hypothetical protein
MRMKRLWAALAAILFIGGLALTGCENPASDATTVENGGGNTGTGNGNAGNDSDNSGNDSGNTGNDSDNSGNDNGNSGNDDGNTGNDSGNSGNDNGNSGNDNGNSGNDSGNSAPATWTVSVIPEMAAYQTMNSVAYREGAGFIIGSGTDWNNPAIARSASGTGPWTVKELTGLAHYDSFVGKISSLNGTFLATRGSGVQYGLVSANGWDDWRETRIGFGTKGHVYGDGVYLVGGQHGQAAYSTDLETWTALTKEQTTFDNGSANRLYVNAAAYGNGIFVLGGGRGHTAVSADKGKTWTGAKGNDSLSELIFDGPNGFIDCMLFVNGRFVALGGMDGEAAKSAWSVDGVAWKQGGSPGLVNGSDSPRMAYGGGYIVAVDSAGHASYSSDEGLTWTAAAAGFGDYTPIKDVAYGNGRFVLVGGEGKTAYCDVN